MDRRDRPTHPVRRLKHWLCRLVRMWVWECTVDAGFSVIGCLYFLRSSSLPLRMFWVVSLSLTFSSHQYYLVSWYPPVLLGSLFVRSTLRFLYPLPPR